MAKECIACGMPMEKPEDFAMRDETKDYCLYCARPDGTMQSYEEKVVSLSQYVAKSRGLDGDGAIAVAKRMMAKLPAWRERSG